MAKNLLHIKISLISSWYRKCLNIQNDQPCSLKNVTLTSHHYAFFLLLSSISGSSLVKQKRSLPVSPKSNPFYFSIIQIRTLYTTYMFVLIQEATWVTTSWGRKCRVFLFFHQKTALHRAFSPSPHRLWTSLILSADLQIPLQLQSNEATQMLPACAFHSQSAEYGACVSVIFSMIWEENTLTRRSGKRKIIPGGVPQHSLRSSICSTSSPINQDPSETSSFAYLCNTCLAIMKFQDVMFWCISRG